MKKVFITAITLTVTLINQAQEFKLPKNTGRLIVSVLGAVIEGYGGNEIIITKTTSNEPIVVKGFKGKVVLEPADGQILPVEIDSIAYDANTSEAKFFPPTIVRTGEEYRSKGLRLMSGDGLLDNTGLGLNVIDKGNIVEIIPVANQTTQTFLIKVPKGLSVSYNLAKSFSRDVTIRNMESEVEVSVTYNSVIVENVTGPLTIKTMYGNIEATLGPNFKSPVSLLSVYGFIDLGIPINTKGNLLMASKMSDVMVSPDLKIEVNKNVSRTDDSRQWTPNKPIEGKLNGGGGEISMKTTYGRIYLRAQ